MILWGWIEEEGGGGGSSKAKSSTKSEMNDCMAYEEWLMAGEIWHLSFSKEM